MKANGVLFAMMVGERPKLMSYAGVWDLGKFFFSSNMFSFLNL